MVLDSLSTACEFNVYRLRHRHEQAAHAHLPMSPSSVKLVLPNGSDVLRLGR